MGIEYYIFNHANATFYELGKGPWVLITDIGLLHQPDNLAKLLWAKWACSAEYNLCLARDIVKFSEGTQKEYLEIRGDYRNDLTWARMLKYRCVGSRYGLLDPIANKEAIDFHNRICNDTDELSETES